MANEIEFPDTEIRYVFEEDYLSFRARVDGQPVECFVTAELLMARFGAREMNEEAMRQAFLEHRAEIQEIAREQIANGWLDEERRIFLTTRFTRLKVAFSERLNEWPPGRALANAANRMLTEIIGPTAEEVIVEWDVGLGTMGLEGISLRIADPSVPFAVKAFLDPKEWENPTMLRVLLAGYWGSVLRGRSRKLFLKSG